MSDAAVALRQELRHAGVVDTHYHVGPEFIVRRYDVKSLADVAAPFGATLVLKNHTYPTTSLASLARARFGAKFLGGVVLNRYVGGLNPQAIEGALSGNRAAVDDSAPDPAPVVVWMPTVHGQSYADAIRVTGPEQVLLSTDFGQLSSDPFPDGTIRYAAKLGELLKGAITRQDFLAMFSSNGRCALGLG